MIVRIFQVTVREGKEEEFREFFLETALPLTRRQPGLVWLTPGLPRPETPREFSMVMVWENLDALKAFAGDDWRDPHIMPEEAALVEARTISHYEFVRD